QTSGLSQSVKAMVMDYVEGFHAAPVDRMSTQALTRAEASAEEEGEGQFRLTNGYSVLAHWFQERLAALGVDLQLESIVKAVRWKRGRVELFAQTPTGARSFRAQQAVITLPLGVLQAQGTGEVVFEPKLSAKEPAIRGLGMGVVVKLTLQFRSRF